MLLAVWLYGLICLLVDVICCVVVYLCFGLFELDSLCSGVVLLVLVSFLCLGLRFGVFYYLVWVFDLRGICGGLRVIMAGLAWRFAYACCFCWFC